MIESDLKLECEIVQRMVDVYAGRASPWEAFFRARQELSRISVFHWDMIDFNDVDIRVVPRSIDAPIDGRLSGLQSA